MAACKSGRRAFDLLKEVFAGEADPCRSHHHQQRAWHVRPRYLQVHRREGSDQRGHPPQRTPQRTSHPADAWPADVMANVCSNYESVEIEVEAAALRAAVHSLLDENDARKNARAAARGTREHHHQAEAGSRLGG